MQLRPYLQACLTEWLPSCRLTRNLFKKKVSLFFRINCCLIVLIMSVKCKVRADDEPKD